MNKCEISIIILTYRKFDNLESNLNSIRKQRFTDYEIIIHDDGSENFNSEYIKSLTTGFANIKIIHNRKNVGTVKNYNLAIAVAVGKYIVPLSQDDSFYDEDTLKTIYDYFEKTNSDVCTSLRIGEKSHRVFPNEFQKKLLKKRDTNMVWIGCAYSNFISGSTLFTRKEFIVKQGLFDDEFMLVEDYPFVMKILQKGVKVNFIDRITTVYGEDGVTARNHIPSPIIVEDNKKVYEKYILSNNNMIRNKLSKKILCSRAIKWGYIHDKTAWFENIDVFMWKIKTRVISIIRKVDLNQVRVNSLLGLEMKGVT